MEVLTPTRANTLASSEQRRIPTIVAPDRRPATLHIRSPHTESGQPQRLLRRKVGTLCRVTGWIVYAGSVMKDNQLRSITGPILKTAALWLWIIYPKSSHNVGNVAIAIYKYRDSKATLILLWPPTSPTHQDKKDLEANFHFYISLGLREIRHHRLPRFHAI